MSDGEWKIDENDNWKIDEIESESAKNNNNINESLVITDDMHRKYVYNKLGLDFYDEKKDNEWE